MGRITITFTVSMPPEMVEQIELVRRLEHRTRSEFIREAVRSYLKQFPKSSDQNAKMLKS